MEYPYYPVCYPYYPVEYPYYPVCYPYYPVYPPGHEISLYRPSGGPLSSAGNNSSFISCRVRSVVSLLPREGDRLGYPTPYTRL